MEHVLQVKTVLLEYSNLWPTIARYQGSSKHMEAVEDLIEKKVWQGLGEGLLY